MLPVYDFATYKYPENRIRELKLLSYNLSFLSSFKIRAIK